MQSGTTGINTTRVYNPIKQAQDHDPQGLFVRDGLPPCAMSLTAGSLSLGKCQTTSVHQRALKLSAFQIHTPLVDLSLATRTAEERLHALRKNDKVRAGQKAVIDKHASRKTFSTRRSSAKSQTNSAQLGFDF